MCCNTGRWMTVLSARPVCSAAIAAPPHRARTRDLPRSNDHVSSSPSGPASCFRIDITLCSTDSSLPTASKTAYGHIENSSSAYESTGALRSYDMRRIKYDIRPLTMSVASMHREYIIRDVYTMEMPPPSISSSVRLVLQIGYFPVKIGSSGLPLLSS